jgi:hypothetical protein
MLYPCITDRQNLAVTRKVKKDKRYCTFPYTWTCDWSFSYKSFRIDGWSCTVLLRTMETVSLFFYCKDIRLLREKLDIHRWALQFHWYSMTNPPVFLCYQSRRNEEKASNNTNLPPRDGTSSSWSIIVVLDEMARSLSSQREGTWFYYYYYCRDTLVLSRFFFCFVWKLFAGTAYSRDSSSP